MGKQVQEQCISPELPWYSKPPYHPLCTYLLTCFPSNVHLFKNIFKIPNQGLYESKLHIYAELLSVDLYIRISCPVLNLTLLDYFFLSRASVFILL